MFTWTPGALTFLHLLILLRFQQQLHCKPAWLCCSCLIFFAFSKFMSDSPQTWFRTNWWFQMYLPSMSHGNNGWYFQLETSMIRISNCQPLGFLMPNDCLEVQFQWTKWIHDIYIYNYWLYIIQNHSCRGPKKRVLTVNTPYNMFIYIYMKQRSPKSQQRWRWGNTMRTSGARWRSIGSCDPARKPNPALDLPWKWWDSEKGIITNSFGNLDVSFFPYIFWWFSAKTRISR